MSCSHNVLEWRAAGLVGGYALHCANCGAKFPHRTDVPRTLHPFHPNTTIKPAEAKPPVGGEAGLKALLQ